MNYWYTVHVTSNPGIPLAVVLHSVDSLNFLLTEVHRDMSRIER